MPNIVIAQAAAQPRSATDQEQFVIQRVLLRLGRPKNLIRTIVRKVWDNQYRVNIYCEDEAHCPLRTAYIITDSFFVTVSGEDIVSKPTISRRYE